MIERRMLFMVALMALCPVLSRAAPADFIAAINAYQEKRFDVAFPQFSELAGIGHARSQFYLAQMHLDGTGTRKSPGHAYGWMRIAAANDFPEAQAQMRQWEGQADAAEAKIADELMAQFGPPAVASRFLPDRACRGAGERTSIKLMEQAHVIGLIPVPLTRISAWHVAAILVERDGRARRVQFIHAVPRGVHEDAVRRAVMRSQFAPATLDGAPTAGWLLFAMDFGYAEDPTGELRRTLAELGKEVERGNRDAAYLSGVILAYTHDTQIRDTEKGRSLMEQAARAGQPDAQLALGYMLMTGQQCSGQESLYWLHQAAAGGVPVAQLTLAQQIHAADPAGLPRSEAVLFWLERAAAAQEPNALRMLGELLTRTVSADPSRALDIGEDLSHRFPDDPSNHALRAAAHARLGHFADAARAQQDALKRARKLKWDTAALEAALQDYKAGRSSPLSSL